ncbi:MAG: tripartite tricarboxylate transporter substrate-binding protein, partial [Xanthobacteraceae bacterium]
AGIQMTHVPYKSGAPALNGLLTGEIDVYFGNASELLQQAASGRVRLLARETRNAAKDAGIADRLLKLGIEPSGADPDEFAEVIRAERDFYRAAAAAAGIKME